MKFGKYDSCRATEPVSQYAFDLRFSLAFPYSPPLTTTLARAPKTDAGTTELTRLRELNRRYVNKIPPRGYWNAQFDVKQLMFMRFNLTVPRTAHLAIFGRRNVAPSITQYDFVEFIKSGRPGRAKREADWTTSEEPVTEAMVVTSTTPSLQDVIEVYPFLHEHHLDLKLGLQGALKDDLEAMTKAEDGNEPEEGANEVMEEPLALPSLSRARRFIHDHSVNLSLVEYLDTGTWYLAIYNDGISVAENFRLFHRFLELLSTTSVSRTQFHSLGF
ncbi:teneurin-a-like [Penaeus chinensis]|uniref:teneurin-a-like n=1 Tax=Penaeus chinensis TaxID=139456 RepID=UPI001FB5BC9C|nr:teneurin-a-like [Penaeus chinensis]